MNLEGSKERYTGGIVGGKGNGEMMCLYYNIKTRTKKILYN